MTEFTAEEAGNYLSIEVAKFCEELNAARPSRSDGMHSTIGAMHCLSAAIARVEGVLSDQQIKALVVPAIELHSESPFVRRLQDWPRGYPGDYETIEYLVGCVPKLEVDHRAYWLEWYALNTAIGQQHRNKIWFQADQIRCVAAMAVPDCISIASVGCGGAADLALLEDLHPRLKVTLIDIDSGALELATGRCSKCAEVVFVNGDALKALRGIKDRFDVILFGGLFDYLSDRYIIQTLKVARRALNSSGRVVFTNIGQDNPFRPWLVHIASWNMIERSDEKLKDLLFEAGFDRRQITINTDETGLAHLVIAK